MEKVDKLLLLIDKCLQIYDVKYLCHVLKCFNTDIVDINNIDGPVSCYYVECICDGKIKKIFWCRLCNYKKRCIWK